MARYAIGDIQGCYDDFMELLKLIDFNKGVDTLFLVGDLVNRGPKSLEVLDWVYANQGCVRLVLGNHDIYLLARYNKIMGAERDDTLGDLLQSPLIKKQINFLRSCPLLVEETDYVMSHAGVYPLLDFKTAKDLHNELCFNLQLDTYPILLGKIYGSKPTLWSKDLSRMQKLRFFVNTTTRMRFLNKEDYALALKYKGDIDNKPDDLIPWFNAPFHKSHTKKIIFGHWAALGFHNQERFVSLDTGCVWGKMLTAINLDTEEVFHVQAKKKS